MTSKRINLTLTPEEVLFISERNLSPTQLLKEKVHEIMAFSAHSEVLLRESQRKATRLTETIEKQRIFIENNGLIEEYLKEGEV